MIKEVTMYSVICDNCGTDANNGAEYSCWSDPDQAWEMSGGDDWIEVEGKHYCPDCASYDDEDNLILKSVKP